MRGHRRRCRLYHFRAAGTYECQNDRFLLPFFVVSGVSIAGLTSDDPYWYNNNFSQLGDRTTFAARMFNSTLTLAGICIVIISYFAVSELITTYRLQLQYWIPMPSMRRRSIFVRGFCCCQSC